MKTKIEIITPAIDLIESLTARGNSQLNSTLDLTRKLRDDIIKYEETIDKINGIFDDDRNTKKLLQQQQIAISQVQVSSRTLLNRIEDAIPLISLALTTSGANLSSALPDSVSPSRLLQASQILSTADGKFESGNYERLQVGPEFKVKLYTIFTSAIRDLKFKNHEITWKEEFTKCSLSLWRIRKEETKDTNQQASGNTNSYHYELVIEEDRDDGRYHNDDEGPLKRRIVDVSIITRLFFSFSGQILELEESESPVLLLKLNKAFGIDDPTNHKISVIDNAEQGDFRPSSTVEWIAFESIPDDHDSEDEIEEVDSFTDEEKSETEDSESNTSLKDLISATENLNINNSFAFKPSLSLYEYLIRLAALQTNDQTSMYDSPDERITLYLREEKGKRPDTADNNYSFNTTTTFDSPRSSYNGSPILSNISPITRQIKARSPSNLSRGPLSTTSPMTRHNKTSVRPKSRLQQLTNSSTNSSSPITTPKSSRIRPQNRGPSPTNLTPWEKDRLANKPDQLLRRVFDDSSISASPFRDKPKTRSSTSQRSKEYPESPIRQRRK